MEQTATSQEEQLLKVLNTYWGYDSFHALQLPAMQSVLNDKDSLVVLPTGGGKSLCYQVPAICHEGLAVVVSPLISLMKDQVDSLRENGIEAAFINSTLSGQEKWAIAEQIDQGTLKMLYVAPERLGQGALLDRLKKTKVSFFAIDEAHCVSQWGHDFRPHYRELARLREEFPDVAMHAYTATATQRVREDIIEQLNLREPDEWIGSFDRANLTYRVVRKNNGMQQVCDIVDRHPNESGIIYCISRKEVERLAYTLDERGYSARPYHAGLSDSERESNQEAFIKDEVQIIVATVAFGMGIDKPDVRYVIHLGMPKTIENYQQETGRAGRDGLPSECHLFFGGRDVQTWQRIFGEQPAALRQASEAALKAMSDFCVGLDCRHQALVQHFGQELEQPCSTSCDICLKEVQLIDDALKYAQMIVSSVYRQEQRFGLEYTALVLMGSQDQRVLDNRHDELSTYGLLGSFSKRVIQDWIGQLIQQGFLKRSGEYGVLTIPEAGSELLRGERQPLLTKPVKKRAKSTSNSQLTTDQQALFEELRELRTSLARDRNVPPYMIFGDATLIEMAQERPTTLAEFLTVSGVGQKKCDDFGEMFTDVIHEFVAASIETTDS